MKTVVSGGDPGATASLRSIQWRSWALYNHRINSNNSGRTSTNYGTTTSLRYGITDLLYATFPIDYDDATGLIPGVLNEIVATLFGFGAEFD